MKKINNIIASGCSWVSHPYDYDTIESKKRGNKVTTSIINYDVAKKYSFSQLLADKLDIDCYNVASAGAANDFIFEKLYKLIEKEKLKNSFVVIGLTDPARHYFHRSPEVAINFKPISSSKNQPKGHKQFKDYFFKHVYREHSRVNHIIMMLDLFYEYLKNKNSKLVVFNSFSVNVTYSNRKYFLQKFNTWMHYIKNYDEKYPISKHPIKYDHEILCDLLYEEFFSKSK